MDTDRRHQNLQTFHKLNNNSLSYSYTIDSGEIGSHSVIVGALHGSEPAGVEAMLRLIEELQAGGKKIEKGQVTFVIGNPEAYAQNERFISLNLNRAFLDSVENNIEAKRAREITHFLTESGADFLMDLHSVSIGDFRAIFRPHNPETQRIANTVSPISTHIGTHNQFIPGLLISAADELGMNAFVVECGNHNYDSTTNTAYEHILNLLTYSGNIDGQIKIEKTDKTKNYTIIDAIKPAKNFYFLTDTIETDTPIKAGQIYARSDKGDYIASQDCVLLIPDKNPKPDDNDAGFLAVISYS